MNTAGVLEKARRIGDETPPSPVPADNTFPHKPDNTSDSLEVPPPSGFRPSSPALSILSIEDYPSIHAGRSPLLPHPPDFSQHAASHAPKPPHPRTWRGRLETAWSRNKGLAYVLVSQFFGVAMNVTTRILEIEGNHGKGYHPFQVLFARMSITLALSSLYLWRQHIPHAPLGPKEVRWLLVLRGFGGFFGVFGIYYSLLYLPLSDATVITFLAPSLACFACSLLLHEPFTRTERYAALVSLLGVVLIARPTSLFSAPGSGAPTAETTAADMTPPTTTPADASDYSHVTPSQRAIAVAVSLLGVLGAATAYTTLRWIGPRAHALISVNYFAFWCTLVSASAMLLLPSVPFALPASPRDCLLLVLLGGCGFVMQFLLAAGLQQERSSRATNMVYCQMLFALAADKVVFGTGPDGWGWAGSCAILGSAVVVAVGRERGEKRRGEGEEERGLVEGMDGGDEEGEEGVRLGVVRG